MRNFLTPGAYVMLAPIGAEVTLQYNVEGNLEKVFAGYRPELSDITSEVMSIFLNEHVVPAKIAVTGGTSWVTGILYTNTLPNTSGEVSEVVADYVWEVFQTNSKLTNFFAALIENTSVPFHNPRTIRQTLQTSGFNLLPNIIVPAHVTDEIVESWPHLNNWTFAPNVVYQYFVFNNNELSIHYDKLKIFNVVDVHVETRLEGEVMCKFINECSEAYWMNYADAVAANIQPDTIILLGESCTPISYIHADGADIFPWNTTRTCSFCGKLYTVPASGVTKCNDIHCSSMLLPKINLFLTQMNIPNPFSIEQWAAKLKKKELLCIPDIFLLPEFESVEVKVTLRQLLRALIPIKLLPNDEVIALFVNKCLHNADTVMYYAEHTDRIQVDLGLQHKDILKLICWLSDAGNVSDLRTCLNISQIVISGVEKQFDGAPIFRNKTIMVTGDFIHGDFSTVAAILRSYSAEVVSTWNNHVDCVLVGGLKTNIDGNAINLARANNKSVQDELAFFAAYEIDDDLYQSANLV